MCNCIKETEERYKKHLKENDPIFKDIENFEVDFANKAYLFNGGDTKLVIPINIKWKHEAKSGKISNKTKTNNFMTDYCPFCGEKQEN